MPLIRFPPSEAEEHYVAVPRCREKACPWMAVREGLCAFHFRDLQEATRHILVPAGEYRGRVGRKPKKQ